MYVYLLLYSHCNCLDYLFDHMIFSPFQAFSINLIFQNSKHAVITLFFPDAFGTALPYETFVQYALLLCWWV